MNEFPMAEEHGGAPEQPQRRGRVAAAFVLGTLLVAAAAIAFVLLRDREEVAPTTPTPAVAPAPVAARPKTATLDGSDESIRNWARQISSAELFAPFFSGGDLARRIVAVIYSISEGESPRALLGFLTPRGQFAVEKSGHALVIAPSSFRRYDPLGKAIGHVEVDAAARAFTALEPVLETAHREIAPPGRTIRQTLLRAIDQLIAVPVPEGPVEVVEKGAIYTFASPTLESLTPAQKHLLRLGPANQRAVQQTLRSLREALGGGTAPRE